MLYDFVKHGVYRSESGFLFQVLHKGKHGQDCSHPMVCYTNLEPTADRPAGEIWMIAESIFLKRFSVVEQWVFDVPEPKNGQWHVQYGLVFMYSNGRWVLVVGMEPKQVRTRATSI